MSSLKILPFLLLIYGISVGQLMADNHQLNSPNGNLQLRIKLTDKLYYAVDYQGQNILWYSPMSMKLSDGKVLGQHPKLKNKKENSVDASIQTVWGIRSKVVDRYNELTLEMEGGYSIVFRAYNEGVAYRFRTNLPGRINVMEEEVSYRFLKNHQLVAHTVGDFETSYEKTYTRKRIARVAEKDFVSLPLYVDQGAFKLVITESDVYDYPGMYLKRKGNNNRFYLDGLFPAYPTKVVPGGWCQFNLRVEERAEEIARTEGKRDFPWRVMVVAKEDKELADNDLVYKLARPAVIQTDWIKAGKVAWDWWNAWNLKGVDFETGINNKTYEYYIDFAARNGIEYIIMDEGWSDQFDLFLQKPGVDVPYLVDYARKKGVGVILWCVWHPLDRQMQRALDQFERWGVAGIKVDFIDRDDQIAINFYERLVKEAAKRKLLVDYHGCSKPTGLHRTYPNLINYEGVRGNEYNKFAKDESPGHNVDIVFTRMLAGPMDYTPGAMRNSTEGNFLIDNSNPMSYGTRCHQLGMYVVYYSPLQMLCDAPTAYEQYPDILKFLSEVPASWDETVALDGKIGEYVLIARRKGKDWYIGALTNWTEREITVDLSFLEKGNYEAQLFLDGVNAHRTAEDYRVETKKVDRSTPLTITLKPGGGAAVHLRKL